MAYRHGIYISEQDTSLIVPAQTTAGLQVIYGTAPVHLADNPYACVNTPVLAYSFAEATKKVGFSDNFGKYTLCQSIDASFRQFAVAPVVLVNVLDPAVHKKDFTETAIPVQNGSAVLALDGVLLDKLVVRTDSLTLQSGTDYEAAFDHDGHPVITLQPGGAAAAAEELTVSGVCIDPQAVTENDVIGGYDAATGRETGMETLRQVFPLLGVTPGLLLAPGWSHKPAVAAVMQAKCEGINGVFSCECIIDLDCAQARAYDQVKTAKEAGAVNSPHAAAVWPQVAIGEKVYAYSAIFGAATAAGDAARDDVPAASPSNYPLPVTRLVGADGVEIALDLEQANFVNGCGVTTALNFSNGFTTWGNNSAAYPGTTDPRNRWFYHRRFFSWWGNSFIRTYFQKVDNPANTRLIQSICDSENIRGNSMVAKGYCAGARIVFAEDENPITQVMDGKIVFHQYLAPYTPAEEINNVLEFDPVALQTALAGG